MKENQTNDGGVNPNIIITHETHSRGMFTPWVVNPHYTVRVNIDGRMHRVHGDYATWDDAYEAGEAYIRRTLYDGYMARLCCEQIRQTLLEEGGAV